MDPYETTDNTSVDSVILTHISLSELQALGGYKVVDNKRVRKPPTRFGYTNMCTLNNLPGAEKIEFSEVLYGPEVEQWKLAMSEELQAFECNEAWELIDVPSDYSIVQSKLV